MSGDENENKRIVKNKKSMREIPNDLSFMP